MIAVRYPEVAGVERVSFRRREEGGGLLSVDLDSKDWEFGPQSGSVGREIIYLRRIEDESDPPYSEITVDVPECPQHHRMNMSFFEKDKDTAYVMFRCPMCLLGRAADDVWTPER